MDKFEMESLIDELILENPKQVKLYRSGKTAFGFFVGMAMKKTEGKLVEQIVVFEKLLKEKLNNNSN